MTTTDDRPRSWADACRRIDILSRWHSEAMAQLDAMRRARDDALADRDHAVTEALHAAKASVQAHDRMEGLRADCERLGAELEALREENDGLRCRVQELEGQA